MDTQIDNRLIDIEIKITRQEDMIDALNTTIYQQQKQIDELELLLRGLAQRLKEANSGLHEQAPANEKPPHY